VLVVDAANKLRGVVSHAELKNVKDGRDELKGIITLNYLLELVKDDAA